ncbi:MAG TPA: ABC transporter permease [Thermoanaerobaculia bacterium]|nr:ABC transporter permease [Thermoanaerobaculia bacterium]
MNKLSQLFALIGFGLKSLPARKGSAAAAIFGIAGVVAVLVGVLSIGEGFQRVMVVAGSPDSVVVLRGGADSEMSSVLSRGDADILAEAPGVARANGKALVSPELFVVIDLPKRSTGTSANVPLRGVKQEAFLLRPEVKIVDGRTFEWGRNEVIVGRSAQSQFGNTDVGTELKLGQNTWKVVGIFEANGAISESEVWADAEVVAPAYRRGNSFNVAQVRLASAGNFEPFKDALTKDPRVNLRIQRETEYYAGQSRALRGLVTGLAFVVCTLMGLGALFGALNTMYTAVSARAREIATLEALGFGGFAVMLSVLVEALLLALIGGVAGATLAYLAFDGYKAATLNWQTFSQVAFSFDVTPQLMISAIEYALVIGLLGGLFPAIRAARMPVAVALREG